MYVLRKKETFFKQRIRGKISIDYWLLDYQCTYVLRKKGDFFQDVVKIYSNILYDGKQIIFQAFKHTNKYFDLIW